MIDILFFKKQAIANIILQKVYRDAGRDPDDIQLMNLLNEKSWNKANTMNQKDVLSRYGWSPAAVRSHI
jgi:hypothetical protein